MASINWTEEQRNILEAKGNIIVSAAAGSGKTAVLTEKIVRRVEEGADIGNMLIVTYTHNAAIEMKERIEEKLYERAEEQTDPEIRAHMLAQAQSVDRGFISTLHSFCTYLLRRHFFDAELSPGFRVGNATELSVLRSEAINEALDEYLEVENEEDGITLSEAVGSDENLIEIVTKLLNVMRSRADGREWLLRAKDKYSLTKEEFLRSDPVQMLYNNGLACVKSGIELLKKALDSVVDEKQIVYFENRLAVYEGIVAEGVDYQRLLELLSGLGKNPSIPRGTDDSVKAMNTEANARFKEAGKCLGGNIDDEYELIRHSGKHMKALIDIVLRFDELFSEKKSKRGIIDFADMEIKALALLKKEEIAALYRNRFTDVFVDEYQDINSVQNEIIKQVMGKDNAFFVGDVKQSIYRFRNAMPELFIEKVAEYSNNQSDHCMELSANFRSSNAVVDFVNKTFATVMRKNTGGVDYDKKQALKKASACGEGKTILDLIELAPVNAETGEALEVEDMLKIETQAARAVVHIRGMLERGSFYDIKEKCVRGFKYSDFAVIMRSLKEAPVFARELIFAGIPVFIEDTKGYFSAIEVQVFINLLKIIDNRRQDIPLISVMCSPIGSFTADELAQVRIIAKEKLPDANKKSFFEAMQFVSGLKYEISKKLKDFLDKLDSWRELSHFVSLEEFVQTVYDESEYYSFVSALPGGRIRMGNLDVFAQLAHSFESDSTKSLYDFLRFLENAETDTDVGAAQDVAQNAVRVLTMHKSKGLEFNAVIIPCLERRAIAVAPSKEAVVYNDSDYIGGKFYNGERSVADLYHIAISQGNGIGLIADEMRLLYVAFTRARDTLILLSCIDKRESFKIISSASESITRTGIHGIDWVALANANTVTQALEEGSAQSNRLLVQCIPATELEFSEKNIDNSIFASQLAELEEIDTSEFDSDLYWEYPYASAINITSKGSVTGFAHSDVYVSYGNSDSRENQLVSATQRGTATHTIFESIPFEQDITLKRVNDFIDSLVQRGIISELEAKSVNTRGIADFFTRPLAKRIMNSERFLREQGFLCFVEANKLSDRYIDDEQVAVQGIIDGCFIEDGKWVILDYKTDSVDKNNPKQVRAQALTHKKQLELYKYVLEKISHIEVKEAYICFVNAWDERVI